MAFNIIDGQNIHGVGSTEAERDVLLINAGRMFPRTHPTPVTVPGTYPPEMVTKPDMQEYGTGFPFKGTSNPKTMRFKQPLPRAGEKD